MLKIVSKLWILLTQGWNCGDKLALNALWRQEELGDLLRFRVRLGTAADGGKRDEKGESMAAHRGSKFVGDEA